MTASEQLFDQAYALHTAGQIDEAKPLYEVCLQQARQSHVWSLQMLGAIAVHEGDNFKGIDLIMQSLKLEPASPAALINLSAAYANIGRHDASLDAINQALQYEPQDVQALHNKAITLRDLGRYEEAVTTHEQAAEQQPTYIETIVALSINLRTLSRFDESLQWLAKALSIKPDHAEARLARALCLLKSGNFADGWREYEWRWKKPALIADHMRYTFPLWHGQEPISGKTILVYREQGMGDFIQFSRFLVQFARRCARVIFEVPHELRPLYSAYEEEIIIAAPGETISITGHVDYCCPLMSLPLALNTQLESIPVQHKYLATPPERVTTWAKRLGQRSSRPRVGIAWSGRPDYEQDHVRSIPLEKFIQLGRQYDVYSLQKEIRATDTAAFSETSIQHFGDELTDLADTAAIIEHMDLVISVDTGVAHLAAALGKPVWLLLPFDSDWRWLSGRTDTPWYPTMRLFRQKEFGKWSDVYTDILLTLANEFAPAQGAEAA